MKKLMSSIIIITVLMSFQTASQKQLQTKPKPTAPVTGIKASVERGKIVYLQFCLSCHQADGGGVPHLNAPLNEATAVLGKDQAKLIRIVLNGMTDRIEIDGEFYSNNMAPHKDLKDLQIADVLTYVRNSWTNKASAVKATEVKTVRAKNK